MTYAADPGIVAPTTTLAPDPRGGGAEEPRRHPTVPDKLIL